MPVRRRSTLPAPRLLRKAGLATLACLAGLALAPALPAPQGLLLQAPFFSGATTAMAAGQDMRRPGQAATEASRRALQKKLADQAARNASEDRHGGSPGQGVSEATARLCVLAGSASPDTLEALLATGADVQVKTRLNMTPLLLAASSNTAQACSVLLRHGASATDADKLGWNAVMQAALSNPHPGVIPLLAKAGVDVNARDASGKTALMLAASRDGACAVRELLALGADRTLRDARGRTALDYARKRRPDGEAARILGAP
ncbi:MAG: ankyrin repeat domain-containing protein [Desulfovibrio sp.]|nr:ankyrin repeat domain-containing protein [Desulfovibrio sp.]